jgi:hypothetical protein
LVRKSLVERVRQYLRPLIARHGFTVASFGPSSMGEEAVRLDSEEFTVKIYRDRGGSEWITVGSKVRPKARAPLRNYLLCRLIAFRDGSEPNPACDLKAEAKWLADHADVVLDSALINSEELRSWNVDAARVMLGEKPRGRWPRPGLIPPQT